MKFKFIALVTMVLLASVSFAQTKQTIKGNEAFKRGYWSAAIDNYKTALKKEKDNELKMQITYNMARSFEKNRDFPNAVNWYKKVIEKGGPFLEQNPEAYLYIANSYKSLEKFEEAINYYTKFAELKPDDKRGVNGQKSSELAMEWMGNPQRYTVENLREVNSKFDDAAPVFGGRKNDEIIFSSYREGGEGSGENDVSGQPFPDLYYAKLDREGNWSKPASVEGEVNSEHAEGRPTLDNRGTTIYFTRCEADEKEIKGCQILYGKKSGRGYGSPMKLELFPDSLAKVIVHPALSPDDEVLYFSANNSEGYGGFDLYYAVWNKREKKFEEPVNLGPEINTPGDELYPYIHKDGTLYFSSNGHIGIGGFDLFKVEKEEEGYGPVTNLKYPLNSSADEVAIAYDGEEERGLITSNRAGGRGRMDIWSFVLPPLELIVTGKICDDKTQELLAGAVVVMTGSDGSVVEDTVNAEGEYRFVLSPNNTYSIQASSDATIVNKFGTEKKKFFASEKALIDVIGVEDSKTFVQDLCLPRIPLGGIELPNIVYEFNKATLMEESKLKLNGLVELLNDNPTLVIELGSHTDFRGSESYNQKLSERRAESAVNYLISKGIHKDRLEFKGYGEFEPKTIDSTKFEKIEAMTVKAKSGKMISVSKADLKNAFPIGTVLNEKFINSLTTEALKEAAHQINRRTEFKVLRSDFKPGEAKKEEE